MIYTPTTDEPRGAEPDRYVFIERAKCPACDSPNLQTIRSQRQDDGTTRRRTRCRTCEHLFFVVVE
jgi:hypothetical protein